jgi:hypothetical protein
MLMGQHPLKISQNEKILSGYRILFIITNLSHRVEPIPSDHFPVEEIPEDGG